MRFQVFPLPTGSRAAVFGSTVGYEYLQFNVRFETSASQSETIFFSYQDRE